MTTSVLSAALFSFMCYALPTSSGKPILAGPHARTVLDGNDGSAWDGRKTWDLSDFSESEPDAEPKSDGEQVAVCVLVDSE